MGKTLSECLQQVCMLSMLQWCSWNGSRRRQWSQFRLCPRRSIRLLSKLHLHPAHHTTSQSLSIQLIQQLELYQINYKEVHMIWDIIQQSGFDKHFQNPNLTIEDLLVDENILTQMQNLNPLLLNFVNNNLDDIVSKLVKYVTIMPKQEQGYDRCHKLPYVSSEMLAIKSQIFYQVFFKNQNGQRNQHLTNLFAFLDSQSADNEILLGYFEKVTNNLFKGKKLQFTSAVVANLPLFIKNLDKETIGSLLTNCVILLDEKEGTLFLQRKKIVSMLVSNLVQPQLASKSSQVRTVCSSALVEIIGRHQTFSSGDHLLNYILCYCGELLLIYSQTEVPEICRFLTGLLTKSTNKIYDPELDQKVCIFTIPIQHQKLLQGFLPLHLHYSPQTIRQQNGGLVNKISQATLDYLTLVAITLENQIDQFLLESQDLDFAWQSMRQHPRNDIVLVQISKIFRYVISDRSKIKDKLHEALLHKFQIVQKFCEIFRNQNEQKLLRPHLFQLWNQLRVWVSADLKNYNKQWNDICEIYSTLILLHTKTAGLNYNRPTNIKIVIDEEDARATQQNEESTCHEAKSEQQTESIKQIEQNIFSPVKGESLQDDKKDKGQWFEEEVKPEEEKKQNSAGFNEFDYFFNKGNEEKQISKEKSLDFSQFGSFM